MDACELQRLAIADTYLVITVFARLHCQVFPYPVCLRRPYEEPFSVKSPVQLTLSDIDYIVYSVCTDDKERFPVSSEVEPLSLSHGEKVSAVVHPCSHPVARTE